MKIDRLMLVALAGGALLGGTVYVKMCLHKEVEDFHIHVSSQFQNLKSNLEISTEANANLVNRHMAGLMESFESYDEVETNRSKLVKLDEIKSKLTQLSSSFPKLDANVHENSETAVYEQCTTEEVQWPTSESSSSSALAYSSSSSALDYSSYSSSLDLFTKKLQHFLRQSECHELLEGLSESYRRLNRDRGDLTAFAEGVSEAIDNIRGPDTAENSQGTALYDMDEFEANKTMIEEGFFFRHGAYLTALDTHADLLETNSQELVASLSTEKWWWQLAGLIYLMGLFLGSYGFIRSLMTITEKAIESRKAGVEYKPGQDRFGLISNLESEMKSIFDEKEDADRQIEILNNKKAVEETAIANLAHDINNLLQVALVNTELLEEKTEEGDPCTVHNNSIRSSISEIVMKLRDLKTGLAEEAQTVHLPSRLDTLTKLLEGEEAKVVVNYKEEDSNVLCIETDLDRILQNLLLNAIEANNRSGGKCVQVNLRRASRPEDGKVLASDSNQLNPDLDYLVIEVSDEGNGISESLGKDIFLLGVTTKTGDQLHDDRDRGRSIGRGLHIVWNKVKNNGGYVDFAPNVRGGTTFSVFLPLMESIKVDAFEIPSAEVNLTEAIGARVVLVEDLPDVRETLDLVLTHQFNYDVNSFGDAMLALESIKKHKPDVIVTDIDLGNLMMTGLEMTRNLREHGVTTPILVITGKNNISVTEINLPSDGVVKLLRKPFETDELNDEIQILLRSERSDGPGDGGNGDAELQSA